MPVLFANIATSSLQSGITTSATQIAISSADAGLFPAPTGGDYFMATVVDQSGNMEIMKCTARTGAVLTVTRAQEGTTAVAFAAGAIVDLRITKGTMETLAQKTDPVITDKLLSAGDTMTGELVIEMPSPSIRMKRTGGLDAHWFVNSSDALCWADDEGDTKFHITSDGVIWSKDIGTVKPYIDAVEENADSRVLKSGDTVTGALTLQDAAGTALFNHLTLQKVGKQAFRLQTEIDGSLSLYQYDSTGGQMRVVMRINTGADGTVLFTTGSGGLYASHHIVATTDLYAGNGTGVFKADGDIHGSRWGGLLSDALAAKFNVGAGPLDVGSTVTAASISQSPIPIGGTGPINLGGQAAAGTWMHVGNFYNLPTASVNNAASMWRRIA